MNRLRHIDGNGRSIFHLRSACELRLSGREHICLYIVLIAALLLRVYRLDAPLMWCDEAESSINALTILERGYPTSTYLGLPIFENVLTEPWPEHPEYEFRDSSYSKQGVAVYHGWLPLYVMAGTFKAFGIEPATNTTNLVAQCTPADVALRTVAPRTQAVAFGMIFLVLIFQVVREMYGKDAGWAALLASAVAVPIVHISRQARYYSLTLMLAMACLLFLWRMHKRGAWRRLHRVRDHGGAAVSHAHVDVHDCVRRGRYIAGDVTDSASPACGRSCSSCAAIGARDRPMGRRNRFLHRSRERSESGGDARPSARPVPLCDRRWPVTIFLALGTAWIATVHFFGHRLPAKLVAPFDGVRGACAFLIAWCVIGWLAFMLLIPAASLWLPCAYLGIVGPGIVLGAILFAGIGRLMQPRYSAVLGCVLFVGFIYGNARASYSWAREISKTQRNVDLIARMRTWELRPGTRVYSTPSDQLILTYYTSMPVQSVAAVRRSYFENYPNDIVVIESFTRFIPANWWEVTQAAKKHDITMSRDEAEKWRDDSPARHLADFVRPMVASVDVPNEALPAFAADVFERQREMTLYYSDVTDNPTGANPAIFRGFDLPDYSWWWQIFFYRYLNVHERAGENLNYRTRIANAARWCCHRPT